MSDYAGPILGAVGAVIGFVATSGSPAGAYWGWSIGSMIGPCEGRSEDPYAWNKDRAEAQHEFA